MHVRETRAVRCMRDHWSLGGYWLARPAGRKFLVLLCFCVFFQMLGVPAPLLDAGGSFDIGESSVLEAWAIHSSSLELYAASGFVRIDERQRSMCVPILAGALFRPPLS